MRYCHVNKNQLVWIIVLLTMVIVFLLIEIRYGCANTITVDDDGEADYKVIQQAIDNASKGDTIVVFPGTYYENVVVNKSVKLIGYGNENSIVDGGGRGDVISIMADNVNISGFFITGSGDETQDAGIKVNSRVINIENNICKNNQNGIYLDASSKCTIINNNITNNLKFGMRLQNPKDCTIDNNTCISNKEYGIYMSTGTNCTILNTNSINNTNGIYLSSLLNCTIMKNACLNNIYGIYLLESKNCSLSKNIINNNSFGIILSQSSKCALINNMCENDDNGLYIWNSKEIKIMRSIIQNNIKGIVLRSSHDNILVKNTIYANAIGIYLQSSSKENTANYNDIINNTEYGINVNDNNDHSLNATYNWWGDESGPYHEDENPDGKGDPVTDYIDFDPWLPRIVQPISVDFLISPYFDLDMSIDDTNDPIENGIIDVFHGDGIVFQELLTDPEADSMTFEWTFHCNESKFETSASGETVSGVVGLDFLYQGLDGGDPIEPTTALQYLVILNVNDGESVESVQYSVQVHPYARQKFVESVNIGASILDASVLLTWRGFEEEAAPAKQYISPEKPVFVHIEVVEPPETDLDRRGCVGPVYDIRVVGCHYQDGEEGFVEAEIYLPYFLQDIDAIGDSFLLSDDLRLEYYSQLDERFVVVPDSKRIADGGVRYVVGSVDHLSVFTLLIDCIYDPLHPNHNMVLPDISIHSMECSRSPMLDGQDGIMEVGVKNTGPMHARDVPVAVYDGSTHLETMIVDIVESSGGRSSVSLPITMVMHNSEQESEVRRITAHANEDQSIEEAPDNYDNNERELTLTIVARGDSCPKPTISQPEDAGTIFGIFEIRGSIGYVDTTTDLDDQEFGNNDFSWTVETIELSSVPIQFARFILTDSKGKDITGGVGSVPSIYGLNFDLQSTNLTFLDNDIDGMVSVGDVLLAKNTVNGGIASSGCQLLLEYSIVDGVNISIDSGEWMIASGTNPWIYEWDTTTVENAIHSIRVLAHVDGINSEIVHIDVEVENIPPNFPPEVTISSHLNQTIVSGEVLLSGVATDSDGDIERIEVRVHNGSWIPGLGTGYWTYQWDSTTVVNGQYLIHARSFDGTEYSDIATVLLVVENTKDEDDESDKIAGVETNIFLLACAIIVVTVVVLGIGMKSRSARKGQPIAGKKRRVCPQCKGPVARKKDDGRWVCHTCKKFIKPVTEPGSSSSKTCPRCGQEAEFAVDYDDYYCWACEEYISDLEE